MTRLPSKTLVNNAKSLPWSYSEEAIQLLQHEKYFADFLE